MRRWLARLSNFLFGHEGERAMNREMTAHLGLLEEEFERRGFDAAEARRQARLAYGGLEQSMELHRDARSLPLLEEFRKDLAYGLRALKRSPGFAAVAILTLALGIGANTAIFTVLNSVLLRPLPYRDADRLVTVLGRGNNPVSPANFLDWQDTSRSFETLGAAEAWSVNHANGNSAERIPALRMTEPLMRTLGVAPLLGRLFSSREEKTGADRVVILSYRLWRRRFAGDPNVVGKQVLLDNQGYQVIGVMPPQFKFAPFWATKAELWAPLALDSRRANRDGNSLRIFGRLKNGVSFEKARAEIASITARLERQYPGTNRNIVVTPLKQNVVGKVEAPLLAVSVAAGFVLLIACVNVAHMLLARTADRQKEVALRLALGASRARVTRQFLTENLLLAVAGAAAGLPLALLCSRALSQINPELVPRVDTVGFDLPAAFFLCLTTLAAALGFGIVPAWQAGRNDVNGPLKEGGRSGGAGLRNKRLCGWLVASEFALAFTLLIGAGLMIRSFAALTAADPGFRPDHLLSAIVSVEGTAEGSAGKREIFYRQLLERMARLPGVVSAGAVNHLPLAGDLWGYSLVREGHPASRPSDAPLAAYRVVMPGYFETMRIPLRKGRVIGWTDDATAPNVAIINETAARQYWPGENPVGQRISLDVTRPTPIWLTIVGVVANVNQISWAADPFAEVYVAALQSPDFLGQGDSHSAYITLVLRTAVEPAKAASALHAAVASFDRSLPVSDVATMDEIVERKTAEPRYEMMLLSAFGALALTLAAVGIYGVMNYSLSQRKREIGIRMSLGAGRAQVMAMVLGEGMAQAGIGAAVGIVAALLLARLMRGLLYGVGPSDPWTFAAVIGVLAVAALLAIALPARRAVNTDPALALREE